ncbi:MAG TPA: hypothetical protein VK110_02940 [Salinisphaeraceae bacterium]|nr:hypothetical protein [Salinisphaeraceae bacterium]
MLRRVISALLLAGAGAVFGSYSIQLRFERLFMTRNHGNSIKDDEQYEALRDEEGMSKEKAARIANTSRQQAGEKGGRHSPYEQWTRDELYTKAQQVGIKGRSNMNKAGLTEALRSH